MRGMPNVDLTAYPGPIPGIVGPAGRLLHCDGQLWISDGDGWLPVRDDYNMGRVLELKEDFLSTAAPVDGTNYGPNQAFLTDWNQTGASMAKASSESGHPGIMTFNVGTVANASRCGFISGDTGIVEVGLGEVFFECCIRIPTLNANGSQDMNIYIGLIDSLTGVPTDGLMFHYSNTSLIWQALRRNNGVSTSSSVGGSNVAAALWYRLAFRINADGSSATFFINGNDVGTFTTGFPGAGEVTGVGVNAIKGNGTTARSYQMDYIYASQRLSRA